MLAILGGQRSLDSGVGKRTTVKEELARYLIEWEIEGKWDPEKARERMKATKENKTVKAWGSTWARGKGSP